MVKIQIVSDIHLEFRGENFNKIIKPSAPILCLLGDVCACGNDGDFLVYKKFISFLAPKFKYILHIPGNHEYYTAGNKNITQSDTISGINNKIHEFLKEFKNVFFLNNKTMRFKIGRKKYVFVGSTLWTFIDLKYRKIIERQMNDYDHIYMNFETQVRKFRTDDMCAMHTESVNFITDEMKNIQPDEIAVLLTHHKPVKDSPNPTVITQAYESDLKDVIVRAPFKLVCFGHTHIKYDNVVNGVRVMSNPKGYISQKTKYNDACAIEL